MCGVITENMDGFPVYCLGYEEIVNQGNILSACLVIAFENIIE